LITRRTSQSSKLLRVPFADYSLSPAAATGCDPAPLQKDDSTLRSRTLLSSCLRGQCRLTLWEPWTPAEPTWPAQAFSSIAAMYPVLASATAPAISGALSTRPNVDGVAGRIQRSELLPSVTPAGLSNRARRTPRSWRGCLATVANVGGRCIQATRDRCFRRRPVLTQVRSMGLWIGSPTRSAALAWTLNKYTPAKGV